MTSFISTKKSLVLIAALISMVWTQDVQAVLDKEDDVQTPGHKVRPSKKRQKKVIDERTQKRPKEESEQHVHLNDSRLNSFLPNVPLDVKLLILSYLDGLSAKALNEVCWNARELVRQRGRLILKSEKVENLFSQTDAITGPLKKLHIIDSTLKLGDCTLLSRFLDRCSQLLSLSLRLPEIFVHLDETFGEKLEKAGPIRELINSIGNRTHLRGLRLAGNVNGKLGLQGYHCYYAKELWAKLSGLKNLSLELNHNQDNTEMNDFIDSLSSLPQLSRLGIEMPDAPQTMVDSIGNALSLQRQLRNFSFACGIGDEHKDMSAFIPLIKNNPRLLFFEVEGLEMSPDFCMALTSLTQLRRFFLSYYVFVPREHFRTKDVEDLFYNFLKGNEKLEELKIGFYYQVDHWRVCSIPFESLPSLRRVTFHSCPTELDIDGFLRLKNIKKVHVFFDNMTLKVRPPEPSENPQLKIIIYGHDSQDLIVGDERPWWYPGLHDA